MGEILKLRLGSDVVCADGPAGTLSRFIVDLETGAVTHLDVAVRHGTGRIVPLGQVKSADTEVHLSCTLQEFSALPPDVVLQEVPMPLPVFDPDALIQRPFLGMGMFSTVGPRYVKQDFVPSGETEIAPHEPVHAKDGHIGHVDGLIVDGGDGHVTHLLLREGHIFGRRTVAIPVAAVTDLGPDGARLSLSKEEVDQLADVPA